MKLFKISFVFALIIFCSYAFADTGKIMTGTRFTTGSANQNLIDSAFSPDGTKFAYSYSKSISTYPFSLRQILMISSPGTTPEVIYQPEPFTVVDNIPFYPSGPRVYCFSSDGSEIIFSEGTYSGIVVTQNGSGFSVTWDQNSGLSYMKAVNIYTKAVRTIVTGMAETTARCSNDGKYIIYNEQASGLDLNLISLNLETGQKALLNGNITTNTFCITSDSKYVIFAGWFDYQVYKVSIEGGSLETIASFDDRLTCLSISNDGNWLLFQQSVSDVITVKYGTTGNQGSSSSTRKLIYAYNINTGKLVNVFENCIFDFSPIIFADTLNIVHGIPLLSPDGSKLTCEMRFAAETEGGSYLIDDFFLFDFDVNEYLKTLGEVAVETDTAPDVFAIKGNYPNPFNPSTTIEFTLGKAEKTSLIIYNIAGQRVRELIGDANLTPGVHSILWNGRDDSGKTVSSGIYFARLLSGEKSSVKSMMFVK